MKSMKVRLKSFNMEHRRCILENLSFKMQYCATDEELYTLTFYIEKSINSKVTINSSVNVFLIGGFKNEDEFLKFVEHFQSPKTLPMASSTVPEKKYNIFRSVFKK